MGLVVGISAMFNLRVLGFAPSVSLKAIERFFPVMWLGFWINAVTGAILLGVNATKLTHNPDFYVKLAFITLAVINVKVLRRRALLAEESSLPAGIKVLAVTSIVFWLGAITSGRLLAYVGRGVF